MSFSERAVARQVVARGGLGNIDGLCADGIAHKAETTAENTIRGFIAAVAPNEIEDAALVGAEWALSDFIIGQGRIQGEFLVIIQVVPEKGGLVPGNDSENVSSTSVVRFLPEVRFRHDAIILYGRIGVGRILVLAFALCKCSTYGPIAV